MVNRQTCEETMTVNETRHHVTDELTDIVDVLSLVRSRLMDVGELECVGQSLTGIHMSIRKLEALRETLNR